MPGRGFDAEKTATDQNVSISTLSKEAAYWSGVTGIEKSSGSFTPVAWFGQ